MVSRDLGDGGIGEAPWASVFDPDANLRAVGEIQARGFRAASEVVDRFIRLAGNTGGAKAGLSSSEPEQTGNKQARESMGRDVDRLVSSWESLMGQLVQSLRGSPAPGFPTLDLTITDAHGVLSLQAVPGGRACSEVWLHNGGPKDLGEVKLRCSDLLRHDGGVVAAHSVRFEPDVVAMPARSSRGVCVEVDVAEDLPAGAYRGTLLAHDHPDVWLPVLLNVPTAS
ncbi:MAG: hypothetical protein QOC62_2989 [Mycobacterium sp.]|nr:hypothetical protein [Mycobacterium sp.]